jgi:RNA polymerase sigma factor (sigma-70 family)
MDAPMTGSDRILPRIAAGVASEAEWRSLVACHGDSMRHAAALATGAERLVDDAVQEALLQLRHCAGSFRPRGGDVEVEVRRWLQGLTVNCALGLRRSERRRHQREAVYAENSMRDARRDESPLAEPLSQAMEGLSQDERQVLILCHTEGLAPHDLAAALGTSEVAARKRLSRAHERLRGRLLRAGCTVSLSAIVTRLDAAQAIGLPPAPTTAWIQAAHAGITPALPAHLATGGVSAMTLTAIVGVPLLAATLAVGSLMAADPPAGPPAAAPAPVSAWKQTAKGSYSWMDAANWTGAVPNARGAVADLNVGVQGAISVNLDPDVTLGALIVGDTGGAPGATTAITGKPLTFEGARPGAATRITLTQGQAPKGAGLDLAAGITLGGTSPLTAGIVSPVAFDCAIREVRLNGNTFTLEGARRAFLNGNHWEGVNWKIGSISGSGAFIQNGAGTTLAGECPDFTGTLTINNGDCHAVRLPAVTRYVVAGAFINKDKYPRGGYLRLGGGTARPSPTSWYPRLNPKATLVLRGGGRFECQGQDLDEMAFFGAPRPVVIEQVQQIQFLCGMSEFALTNGNFVSSATVLQITDPANPVVRQQGATVMMSGDGLRTTQGYWAALGMAERVIVAGGMARHLKGAGGPPGSTRRSLIPWITIGTDHHPAEGGFATYDEGTGLHSLLEHDEYDRTLTGTPDRNVKCDNLSLGSNKQQTVNSLTYGSWGNSDIGAGSTLTITSGALMMGSMGGAAIGLTPGQGGTIDFGPAEGVIWPPFVTPYGKDIAIGSTIAGSGGLTKAGTSTLVLTAANTYTGRTCIGGGVLQVGDGTLATSRLGDGDVEVTPGATLHIKANVANAIADTATVVLQSAGTAFFGTLQLDPGIHETVAGLILEGREQPAGTYGGKESGAAIKLESYFSGPGILTVSGKGAAAKPKR